jgi:hypothetical protein
VTLYPIGTLSGGAARCPRTIPIPDPDPVGDRTYCALAVPLRLTNSRQRPSCPRTTRPIPANVTIIPDAMCQPVPVSMVSLKPCRAITPTPCKATKATPSATTGQAASQASVATEMARRQTTKGDQGIHHKLAKHQRERHSSKNDWGINTNIRDRPRPRGAKTVTGSA